MARVTLELKAAAVAEYWLTGSYRYVGRAMAVDHKSVALWVGQAEAPRNSPDKKVRERALKLFELRQATLEAAFNRALELQMRDLAGADFRDRTGFLKIIGELRLSLPGRPPQGGASDGAGKANGSTGLDAEIRDLLVEMAEREASSSNGTG
jgi:hypothetical protein